MNENTSFIVKTKSAAVICFDAAAVRACVGMIVDAAVTGLFACDVELAIEHRLSADVRKFLDSPVLENGKGGGEAKTSDQGKGKPAMSKKKPSAKLAAPAAPRKAPGGKKTNKQIVLDFLAGIDRDSSMDMRDICKRTKLPTTTVSPILSTLKNNSDVGVVTGEKRLQFYGIAPAAAKSLVKKDVAAGTKVTCAARGGRQITIDTCVPNEESGACRRCEHVKEGGC